MKFLHTANNNSYFSTEFIKKFAKFIVIKFIVFVISFICWSEQILWALLLRLLVPLFSFKLISAGWKYEISLIVTRLSGKPVQSPISENKS